MQKIAKNSPSGHHRTLSGYIFATRARIDNRKKPVKLQYLPHTHVPHTSLQYGELQHTSAGDLLASLGHPSKFQRVLHLGSVTAQHSISGRLPNCGIEQRAPAIFGKATITFGIGPHCSSYIKLLWIIYSRQSTATDTAMLSMRVYVNTSWR